MAVVISLLLFLILSCSSMPPSSQNVARIDQIQYLAELKKARPNLIKEDCKSNLIAKPEFRQQILEGSSMAFLIKERYSPQMKADDLKWANEYRHEQKQTSGFRVAKYYDPSYYFGYLVGVNKPKEDKNLLTHPFIDDRGIGYKVFFQLKNFQKDLRASHFQLFAQALAKAGFRGDLKVQLNPGNARFKFNNIVVHSASKQDSVIAEQVGLSFFKGQLSAISRGVDVDIDPKGKLEALDWSEFLCTRDFTDLPLDVRDYVNYK